VPDTTLDAARAGDLEIRVASTRGAARRFYGDVRQDFAAACGLADQHIAVAVADGLGSAEHSHIGARSAVEACLGFLKAHCSSVPVNPELLELAIHEADGAVRTAEQAAGPVDTTLTVLTIEVRPTIGGYAYCAARIGDSPVFVLVDGALRAVFPTASSEIDDTRTDSLPSPRCGVASETGVLQPRSAIIAMSDGLGETLQREDVRAYICHQWSNPPGPLEFLRHLQFHCRTYDDDRSAAGVWAV
jgi:hypothetical protein